MGNFSLKSQYIPMVKQKGSVEIEKYQRWIHFLLYKLRCLQGSPALRTGRNCTGVKLRNVFICVRYHKIIFS